MSKKTLISSLMTASIIAHACNMRDYHSLNQKQLEGSPIYIPKRHKYKKNKR